MKFIIIKALLISMLLCYISSEKNKNKRNKKVSRKNVSLKKIDRWGIDDILYCPEISIKDADEKELINKKGSFMPFNVVDTGDNVYGKRQIYVKGIYINFDSDLDPQIDFFWFNQKNPNIINPFRHALLNYRFFYEHKMEFFSPKGKNRYLEGKFTTDDKKTKTLKIVFEYSKYSNYITPEQGLEMAQKFNRNAKLQGERILEVKKEILKKFESGQLLSQIILDKHHQLFKELIHLAPEKEKFITDYMLKNDSYQQKEIEEFFDKFYP